MFFFLQANFYDKAAGLRKMADDTDQTSTVVMIGLALIAVFGVMAWFYSRANRYKGPERRGAPQGIIRAKPAQDEVGITVEKDAPSLAAWAGVAGLRLIFNLDGRRVQRPIRAVKSGPAALTVQGMNLDHLEETVGRMAVVDQNSVLLYEVLVRTGVQKGALVLEPQANATTSRVASAARTPANGVAKLITSGGDLNAQMIDLGVEGVGLLLDTILAVGTAVEVAFTIPGTATEIRASGRVAWAKPNAAGACRAGVQISGHDDAARANLADFVLTARQQTM